MTERSRRLVSQAWQKLIASLLIGAALLAALPAPGAPPVSPAPPAKVKALPNEQVTRQTEEHVGSRRGAVIDLRLPEGHPPNTALNHASDTYEGNAQKEGRGRLNQVLGSSLPDEDNPRQLAARLHPPPHSVPPGLFKQLTALNYQPFKTVFVSVDVAKFDREFSQGAQDPVATFAGMKDPHAQLARAWTKVRPPKERIFIIGASEDAPVVKELAERLQAEGHEVFFYKNCQRLAGTLCTSQQVGAFQATADAVLVVDSPAARNSPFVQVETERTASYRGLRPHFSVMTLKALREGMDEARRQNSAQAKVEGVAMRWSEKPELAAKPKPREGIELLQ